MYVRVRYNGKVDVVNVKSKLALVNVIRREVEKLTGIKKDRQRLFHMGKQLEDGYKLFDYDIKINAMIEVSERVVVPKENKKAKKSKKDADDKDKDKDVDAGSEHEDKENSSGAENGAEKQNDNEEDKEAMETEETEEKVKEEDKDKEEDSVAASSEGSSAAPTASTSSEGDVIKIEDIYNGDPKDLVDNNGYDCKRCKNNPDKPCKECGCNECGLKDRDDMTLVCDECEYYYHLDCLDPPLEKIPEGDWYCPCCRNDDNEIVKPGAYLKASKKKAKMPSAKNCKRDWGNGMATVGRSKSCTKVPSDHFGPIPGIDVGMCWKYRIQLSEEGVHRPPVAGIAGQPTKGSQSIVLAGGYEDDADNGDEFYYTGAGGRDLSGNKRTAEQSFDQELTKSNLALAVSCNAKVRIKILMQTLKSFSILNHLVCCRLTPRTALRPPTGRRASRSGS